jgi:hypothetical protein
MSDKIQVNQQNIIFIFSLPRAGSTLLQKILMEHSAISSAAEPWLLLPIAYSLKKEGILTEYSHQAYFRAYSDFISSSPNLEQNYTKELGKALSSIYQLKCSNSDLYFLDKTPRYHLIIDVIKKLFPEAKFIFLFRNPLDCYASILDTFCNNSFYRINSYKIDLYKGVNSLSNYYNLYKDQSHKIEYENLVKEPEDVIKKVLKYLDLEWEEQLFNSIGSNPFENKFGDPKGYKKFNKISTKSIDIWKSSMNTPIRLWIAKKYLQHFEDEVLLPHGVNKEKLLKDIRSTPWKIKYMLKDILALIYTYWGQKLKLNLFFGKTRNWSRDIELS